jgi:hypothetical protein
VAAAEGYLEARMFPAAEQRAPKLMGFLDLAAASVASLQPVSKKHQPEPSALDRKRSRKHPKKGEGRRSIPLDCCTIVGRASRKALSLLGALRLVELIVIAAR